MKIQLFAFFQHRPISRHHQMLLASCYLMAMGFILPVRAQITSDNAVFPVVGDTLHFAFGNQPGAINQIFTPPGGDQQWDLSNLQPTQFWDQIMKDPQTGTAAASFPGASILFNPLNSNDEFYLQVTGNQVNDMGYYGHDELNLGLSLLFKKSPVLEQSWAPVNFFDIRQSSANVLTAFDAPIAPAFLLALVPTADSFRTRITYQRVSAIDAWGTLAIPGGTFEVLRKKQTEYKSTAVDVKVAPLGWIDISTIGGQQLLPLGTDTITTFHFLNNVSKEAIAICTLNTAQNAVTGVQYKVVSPPVGTDDLWLKKEHFSLYPNPAQHSVTLRWELLEDADVRIVVTDATGRQLQTLLDGHLSAGPQLTQHALAPMHSGLHFVQILTNGALQYTAKLLVL
ncbi:MAG: T9SS type A sorting domain-containing protein [Saprospiraceae bacterium]